MDMFGRCKVDLYLKERVLFQSVLLQSVVVRLVVVRLVVVRAYRLVCRLAWV